jgi:hypothetical protein
MENSVQQCPTCHKSDKVEKVSDIVTDGFSTTPEEGAKPYQWAGQTYYIRYKEEEPEGPITSTDPKTGRTKVIGYTMNWYISPRERITNSPVADRLLPSIEKPAPPSNYLPKGGCFFLAWPWLMLFRKIVNWTYINFEADYTEKIRKKAEAEARWSKLYYCYRCEGVFSEETDFIPVMKLNNYLFDLDPNRCFRRK